MEDTNLEKELRDLKEGNIVLIETSAEKALKIGIDSIKSMTSKKYTCIILSASRPCSNLLQLYKDNKIDSKKIFVLCAVCKSQGLSFKDSPNILHVENASDLTSMSISLNEAIHVLGGKSHIC